MAAAYDTRIDSVPESGRGPTVDGILRLPLLCVAASPCIRTMSWLPCPCHGFSNECAIHGHNIITHVRALYMSDASIDLFFETCTSTQNPPCKHDRVTASSHGAPSRSSTGHKTFGSDRNQCQGTAPGMAFPNCIKRAAMHQMLLHSKRILVPRVFGLAMEPERVPYRTLISLSSSSYSVPNTSQDGRRHDERRSTV